MAALHEAFAEATAGRGRLVLLAGDPGIGKTRTAEELAVHARVEGADVLWGRCHEGEGAPAYWPWLQVIRAYARARDPETLRSEMGSGAGAIAQIAPEVRDRWPDLPEPTPLRAEQARFRLFDSVTLFLKAAAVRRPLVLVLDDLQWADRASLLLLSFVARELGSARVLVIGMYRDLEVGRQHPLTAVLGELAHEPVSQRIFLRGLAEPEVARCIALNAGAEPSGSVVSAVLSRTEGNPFFVRELADLLASEGALEDVIVARNVLPRGVREVIGRRRDRLSSKCNDLLDTAAVIGRTFDVEVLQAVGETRDREQILTAMAEAVAAHLIVEVSRAAGCYRFAHDLIRESLHGDLPVDRRLTLHRHIGEFLEARHAHDPEPHIARLARHFVEAAEGGRDLEKAITYSRRAGDRALAVLAYEEAAVHYEHALHILERTEAPSEEERCELLLARSLAQWRAGDGPAGRETARSAADLGRRLGAPERLARAALLFSGRSSVDPDPELVRLLEEALAALDESDSTLRVSLLSRLAMALHFVPGLPGRSADLALAAVEMARRLGDPAALADALRGRHFALRQSIAIEERLAVASEIVRLAEVAGDRELAMEGRDYRAGDLLELGDVRAADTDIATYARLAEELRQPKYLWCVAALGSLRASMEGCFEDAETLAERALTIGQPVQPWNARSTAGGLIFMLRVQQGRLEELVEAMSEFVALYPELPAFRAPLAFVHAELGHVEAARQELDSLATDELVGLTHPLSANSLLAAACASIGDARRAALLYDRLLPYAGRNVAVAPALCMGAVGRYLGLLASTMERWEDAQAHFEDALQLNTAMGAHPWLAFTQHDYATMLLRRDGRGDRERAVALVGSALATAEALGMEGLRAKAAALQSRLGGVASAEAPDTAGSECVFRRDGDYWTIAYEGRALRLRDARGLRYLAQLLHHPGREFHVSELVAGAPGSEARAPSGRSLGDDLSVGGLGDAGTVLDAQATEEYRRRLAELREELAEAERLNDLGQMGRAREEIEVLSDQLVAAGRGRKAASHSERARLTVTKGIKTALERISESHAALGRHLSATVRRGYFCVYLPDPRRPISWDG
jgi:tetratricopeptide (TPR) repeat protein